MNDPIHPGVIYQVYPRSFMDSNADGVGDIRGIIDKLEYIKSLGVNTVWLSPVFCSPHTDFGYDISDYYHVDPIFGTDDDLDELIRKTHESGMKVVLDMVMNHTSIEHPWFKASVNKEEPYTDWYIWHAGKGNKEPNNWKSTTGGSGWHFHPKRREWYYASFLPFQPDLNYHNPAVKKAMFDMAQHWLKKGADGFRLDIFNVIYKDKDFTANPISWRYVPNEVKQESFFQKMRYTVNSSLNFQLAKELRAACEAVNPGAFLLGEVFGDIDTLRQYVGKGDGLNYVFLFEMLHFKPRASFFREKLLKFEQHFPPPFQPTFVFGNHDRRRPLWRLKGDIEKWKLVALFQLTARGVPVIYMGEEIGMEQHDLPLKTAKDPIAHKYSWVPQCLSKYLPEDLNRDNCRTPMQWNGSANAGFTRAKEPWLPVHSNYRERNVAIEEDDPDSLLHWYKTLLSLRNELISLRGGELEMITTGFEEQLLAYKRKAGDQVMEVYINFSNSQISIPADGDILASSGRAELNGSLLIGPWSGCIVKKK